MFDFIIFDTDHKYTDFDTAREFLRKNGFPIVAPETIKETTQPIKNGKATSYSKNPNPYHFELTVYDQTEKCNVNVDLYFNDYRLILDCKSGNASVACHEFIDKWQVFVAFCLKGATQSKYIKAIENQMIKNLQATDREFLDEMMQKPEIEDELADRHDFIIKETLFSFNYLKALEKNFGLLHEQAYNPFAHPYFNKKEKAPSLAEIVSQANMKKQEQQSLCKLQETEKEC